MAHLCFTRYESNGEIAQRIRESTHGDADFIPLKPIIHALKFYEIDFDSQVASAVKSLFRSISANDLEICEPSDGNIPESRRENQKLTGPRVLHQFTLISCPGNNSHLEEVLRMAIELDVVQNYEIKGFTGQERQQQRRIRRWMSIPPSERPLDSGQYIQPSLEPFARIEHQRSRSSSSSSNSNDNDNDNDNDKTSNRTVKKNVRGFSLSCFRVSCEDMKLLRKGILSSTFGNLEVLSFSNVAFLDDGSVNELAEAVAALSQSESQQSQTRSDCQSMYLLPETSMTGLVNDNHLCELNLVRCDLSDDRLELIVRSMMTTKLDNSGATVPISASITMKSTLSRLDISRNRCGEKTLAALGAWLLNHWDLKTVSNILPCSCSLEGLKISSNYERESNDTNSLQLRYLTRPMLMRTDHHSDKTCINRTLKTLCLNGNARLGGKEEDGGVDMGYLGLFVSKHLTALEELDLDFCGISDVDLARFASASRLQLSSTSSVTTAPEAARDAKSSTSPAATSNADASVLPNISLRKLRLLTNVQLPPKSAESLVTILDRYPMLKDLPIGDYRQKSFWRGTIHEHRVRHLLNINECGRVLLFSPFRNGCHDKQQHRDDKHPHEESVPMSLWPSVLEFINRRFLSGPCILRHDSRMLAANGIYFLIRNNVAMVLRRSNSDGDAVVETFAREASDPSASIQGNDDTATTHLPLVGTASAEQRRSDDAVTKRKRCNTSVDNVDNEDERERRQRGQSFS